MRIKGKLVKNIEQVDDYKEAEIELPPVDLSKIKEGDEVWVKCKLRDVQYSQKMVIAMAHKMKDIIAHFSPEKPKDRIEELDFYDCPLNLDNSHSKALVKIQDKLNEIIKHLNSPK